MDEASLDHRSEDENYFVSMTDMMIGLVFIFIIMLMYFALQASQQRDEASEQQRQAEQTQLTLERERAANEAERAANDVTRRQLLADRADAEEARRVATLREAEALRQREDAERREADARAAREEADRDREVLRQRLAELEEINRRLTEIDEARTALLQDLQGRLAAEGLDVEILTDQGILRLGGNLVLFDVNQARPTSQGLESLDAIARALAEVLPCYSVDPEPGTASLVECNLIPGQFSIESVYIEGHTDNQRMAVGAQFQDNLALSAARAAESYRLLLAEAPILGRLCHVENGGCQPILGVSGYGELRWVADNGTLEGQAANRRIDFRIIMAAPDLDELQADIDRELGPAPAP